MEYEIAATSILILMLVFIATFESAIGQLSDVALRSLTAESKSKKQARFLRYLLSHHQLLEMTTLSGLQFSAVSIALLLVSIGLQLTLTKIEALLGSFAVSLLIGGIFGQFLPRLFTQNNPASMLLLLLPYFAIYYKVFSIPAQFVYWILRRFRRDDERSITPEQAEEVSGENIKALLDVGTEEGIIEEAESKLIHSVIEFTDTTVDEVMIPRPDMIMLDANATVEQMRDLMIDKKHSRIPVYRDSIDHIEGIVYMHDVLAVFREGQTKKTVSSILRPVYFVPETKLVAELLTDMQRAKRQIALVVDEYGVTAGLVTIKDLLEEIVGEIGNEETDKNDRKDPEILEISTGIYLVKGSTEIKKIETLFNKELERDDFSTLAGFIIKHAGCVPNVGDTLVYQGVKAEIIESDNGRIGKVKLYLTEEADNVTSKNNSA
ncbi:MAG: HlyC/CorC family transporter [Acidobacteria bacterium]|nr:HlyC/CorC family transporter [Acidobacteriota bacterium]